MFETSAELLPSVCVCLESTLGPKKMQRFLGYGVGGDDT